MQRNERYTHIGIGLAIVGLITWVLNVDQSPTEPSVVKFKEIQRVGCLEAFVVGKSNMGFEIELCRVVGSDINSADSLLVIGTIHGNEPAGKKVVDELLRLGAAEQTDLWVIRDANPDGSLRATRQNKNGVDLNRNFVTNWLPSEPGIRDYSGSNPASEPETHALMRSIDYVKPKILITIHQPYAVVDCSMGKDRNLDERLAELTGLPTACIPGEMSGSPSNEYTGTITQWVNERYPQSTAIALELGAQVEPRQSADYAKALQVIAKSP